MGLSPLSFSFFLFFSFSQRYLYHLGEHYKFLVVQEDIDEILNLA
jgi:hypothetical protein